MTYPQTIGYQDNENSKAMAAWLEETSKGESLRHQVYNEIAARGFDGRTTEEVSRALGIYNSGVPARFRELELGGCIIQTGLKRKKPGGKRLLNIYASTGKPYTPVIRTPKMFIGHDPASKNGDETATLAFMELKKLQKIQAEAELMFPLYQYAREYYNKAFNATGVRNQGIEEILKKAKELTSE